MSDHSDERTGSYFTVAVEPHHPIPSQVHLGGGITTRSYCLKFGIPEILLSQVWYSHNLKGQVSHIYFPWEQGSPVVPPGIGWTPATTSTGFIKPTQHKPQMRVNVCTP
jgi:hypothetical protein